MDITLFVKALLCLIGIIALIFLAAKIVLIYVGKGSLTLYNNKERQIKITEKMHLDTKRTLIRFNDSKNSYLILLGVQGELLLNKDPISIERCDEKNP